MQCVKMSHALINHMFTVYMYLFSSLSFALHPPAEFCVRKMTIDAILLHTKNKTDR